MNSKHLCAAVFAFATNLASSSFAVTLAQHTGNSNPLTEGWSFSSDAAGSFLGGTEIVNSTSIEYWETQDTSPSNYRAYVMALPETTRDNDWSVSAQVRVISSPPAFSGTTAGGQSVAVSDGLTIWQFNLRGDRAGPVGPFPFNIVSPALLDTTASYHTYRIDFHINQSGAADDTASFYINGNLVISSVNRSQLAATSGSPQILFGNASSPGLSAARYSSVVLTAVPEPASTSLFLVGAVLVGALAIRRKP